MERGLTRVTEVLVILIPLLLSAPFAMTPAVRAQSGQWVVTTSLQASFSTGTATVTASASGSATLNVDDQGRITGTGNFQGSVTATAAAGCSGGGTIPFTEHDTYSGHMASSATGDATLYVTASGSSAPASLTVACPNPSPPPATISNSVPIPSQMSTAAGTYSLPLVDGYTRTYNFPAPVTGSYSMSVRGGAATTTTASSTSSSALQVNGSLGLTVPFGEVKLCDSSYNNCKKVRGGETLQPGQCIITSSGSGVNALGANMEVAIGENSLFCLPATRGEISSLCTWAQTYNMIQGQVHVGTWGMHLGQNVYIRTPYMGVCDKGTEFIIRASGSGTTAMVLNDTVLATDLTSNSTVRLVTGQMLTIQNSTSGMSQMAMQQAVLSFDPGSVNKWWLSSGTSTASPTSSGTASAEVPTVVFVAVLVIIILAIAALALSKTRSRRSA